MKSVSWYVPTVFFGVNRRMKGPLYRKMNGCAMTEKSRATGNVHWQTTIFDPINGEANGTFGAIIIVGKGFHGDVFAIVFQGDEEFISDGQC